MRLAALPQRRSVSRWREDVPLLLLQRIHRQPVSGTHTAILLQNRSFSFFLRYPFVKDVLTVAAQMPVDWCRRSNPCQNGGRCRPKDGSFTCDCVGSWSGRYCDVPGVSCEVAAFQRGISERTCLVAVTSTCPCRSLLISAFPFFPCILRCRSSDGRALRSRRSLC